MVSDKVWSAFNTIHGVVYAHANHGDSYTRIGLDDPWTNYFASRSAALGEPSAELVAATFFGYSPAMIGQHIPRAWTITSAESVLAVRREIAARALAHLDERAAVIADSLIDLISGLTLGGASLAAAHISLDVPDSPSLKLWHAATVLREYRGDRHWAVLTAAGLNGPSAQALAVATGRQKRGQQRRTGWTDAEWDQAFADLRTRGWADDERQGTETGIAARNQLEEATTRVTLAGFDTEARARLEAADKQIQNLAAQVTA